jgi:hypothetical protein
MWQAFATRDYHPTITRSTVKLSLIFGSANKDTTIANLSCFNKRDKAQTASKLRALTLTARHTAALKAT